MSNIVAWNPDYSVGVEEIDKQHKKIFEIINKLTEAIEAGKNKRTISDILADISIYLSYHFTSEEFYFEGHPELDAHHLKHLKCTEKLLNFERKSRPMTP